jgi:uncharacterized protein YjbI with pentapeptide repeats
VSDILLCAFLRLSGEDMFEFVHKSFMEYFSAEYIATALVESPWNELVSELNYDLNQEIMQFIGGLSTAFVNLTSRLIAQLGFTLPSGSNIYRKNLACALLYSNKDTAIELARVAIADCNFRRKAIKGSLFAGVQFLNCTFTDVTVTRLQANDVRFQDCKFVGGQLSDVTGELSFSDSLCEKTSLSGTQAGWKNVRFRDATVTSSSIRFESDVAVSQAALSQTTISLQNRTSLKNVIEETTIVNSQIVQTGNTVALGGEIKLLKNAQLTLTKCNLKDVTLVYPVLEPDQYSLDNLRNCSGIFSRRSLTLARRLDLLRF